MRQAGDSDAHDRHSMPSTKRITWRPRSRGADRLTRRAAIVTSV
jgi:hypothetical protein